VTLPTQRYVRFDVADTPFCLRFDVNVLCELEELLSAPAHVLLQRIAPPPGVTATAGYREWRAFLWAGLRGYVRSYGGTERTLDQAGDLLGEYGVESFAGPITEALILAMPAHRSGNGDAKEEDAAEGEAGRRPGETSGGAASSSEPSKPASTTTASPA